MNNFGKTYLSIKQPLTAHYPIHQQASFFLESMFIDQATHNGTRPNSPLGVEPATTPSGPLRYGSTPWMGPTPEDLSVTGFVRWPSVSLVKKIVGWVISSADGIAFQSLVDAMSSVRK